MENVLKCKLCLHTYNNELRSPTLILCGHTFCKLCISKAENSKCALCGLTVDMNVKIQNHIVEEMLRIINYKPDRKGSGMTTFNLNGYIRQSNYL
jgi:hypothetical protein